MNWRGFYSLKLKGFKITSLQNNFYPTDERLDHIYDICEKYDKPIIFMSGLSWEPDTLARYSRPIEFEELAYKDQIYVFVFAHFGWPWVQETAMLI